MAEFTFQLTTSHRGRQNTGKSNPRPQNFNSLPHTEVDLRSQLLRYLCEYFNSLPHTEVDWLQEQIDKVYFHFNSLPHTEVDKSG